jgi:hypothetical protein
MFTFLEIGRRIGLATAVKKSQTTSSNNVGAVETVIFSLLGLLIAFTFTGAETRFEARRQLITVEANAIGTAYLRIDLLPKEVQPQMREFFKKYTQIRANIYQHLDDPTATKSMADTSALLQKQIWSLATSNCQKTGMPTYCAMLVLPALNDMIDITTTRLVALSNHPPTIIYILLLSLSLLSAVLIGYDLPFGNQRNLLYMLSYAIIISLALYLIIDLEMPRFGFIQITAADKVLMDLKNSM